MKKDVQWELLRTGCLNCSTFVPTISPPAVMIFKSYCLGCAALLGIGMHTPHARDIKAERVNS